MTSVEVQTEQMEEFMDETQSTFATSYSGTAEENKELENLMTNEAVSANMTESMIDKELEELKKKMNS